MSKNTRNNFKIRFGEIEVVELTDTRLSFPFPLDHVFPGVSEEGWETFRDLYPETFSGPNTWASRINCYLVRTPERTILVDTGLGPASTTFAQMVQAKGELLERLQAEGVSPDQVDTVFLSHLHPDHVGWNIQNGGGQARPTFPEARYLAHQADWEMCERLLAADPVAAAHIPENILPLRQLDCLTLITGEIELAEGIRALPTPGHTPGHMSLKIEPGNGVGLLLLGDAVVHPLQIDEPDQAYSMEADAQAARETRGQLLERIAAENLRIAACHFPEPGFGQVIRENGKWRWQAISEG